MNQISAESEMAYNLVRREVQTDLADIQKQLEAQICKEVTQDYSYLLTQASWWRKIVLKREIRRAIQRQTQEVFERFLAEQKVPKASAESLW